MRESPRVERLIRNIEFTVKGKVTEGLAAVRTGNGKAEPDSEIEGLWQPAPIGEHRPPAEDARTAADGENAASIALLRSWLAEDATNDPDEIRRAQERLDEFKQSINAERERAGSRRIYP